MGQRQEMLVEGAALHAVEGAPAPRRVAVLRPRRAALLVEPKLRRPLPGPGHVARPHLVAHLDRLTRHRLTVVTALAGFGKTGLLAEWAAAPGHDPVAWVSLDAADADPVRLWAHVAEAMRRAGDGAVEEIPHDAPPADVSARLLNGLSRHGQGMVLVLDDHQAVPADALSRELAPFVLRLPAGVRVVVAGRRAPRLPLSLLRARGELAELAADLLRLRVDEALRMPDGPGEREMEGCVRSTGGWPACVALAAAPGGARHLRDYVADEVLAEEDPGDVRFLELTAALDELRGPTCDDLLESCDSQARLRALSRSTPIVAMVNGTGTRFRCEPLVRSVLLDRLAEGEPALADRLRARAVTLSGAAVSEAEMRVLRLLPTSLTLREIGERLFLSLNTVKTHTRSLHRKLGVSSRAEAVERARALGIL